MPVYGTFQFIREKVPKMLSLLWEYSQTLSNDYADQNTALTFAEVYQGLADMNIPSIPAGGIIIWVLIADFFEYGICLAPTEQDLAEHIMPTVKGRHGTPAGPTAALKHAAALAKEKMPKDAAALTTAFRKVFEVLNNPTEEMPTIQRLVRECEQIQGRKLNVVDFEHGKAYFYTNLPFSYVGARSQGIVLGPALFLYSCVLGDWLLDSHLPIQNQGIPTNQIIALCKIARQLTVARRLENRKQKA